MRLASEMGEQLRRLQRCTAEHSSVLPHSPTDRGVTADTRHESEHQYGCSRLARAVLVNFARKPCGEDATDVGAGDEAIAPAGFGRAHNQHPPHTKGVLV